ncbi:Asp-tRNA(Asn)/Glu-tRNA(Gln) amidotransferase subunit GatC [Candidatus Daviesbacteria bacterium]|nr:Asp-tRNA(Asn)/Glu-tRNA(Gln) amidotransferase subunit GatC [Candidatus Daviesbacteria bacterium]
MKLTKDKVRLGQDKVKHVAKLANLPLSSEEEEKYPEQLSKILEYVEQLNKVDTSNVEPTFNVSGQSNVVRVDKVGECLNQEEALSNAPKKENARLQTPERSDGGQGFFVTKGVFAE